MDTHTVQILEILRKRPQNGLPTGQIKIRGLCVGQNGQSHTVFAGFNTYKYATVQVASDPGGKKADKNKNMNFKPSN